MGFKFGKFLLFVTSQKGQVHLSLHSERSHFRFPQQPKAESRERPIQKKKFVAKSIVPPKRGIVVEGEAERGCKHGHEGHPTVVDLAAGVKPIEEKTKERAVGIGGQHKDGVDDAAPSDGVEEQEAEVTKQGYDKMDTPTQMRVVRTAEEVDADAGGKGGEGTISC